VNIWRRENSGTADWYSAIITKINDDGSIDVKYDDGNKEKAISIERINFITAKLETIETSLLKPQEEPGSLSRKRGRPPGKQGRPPEKPERQPEEGTNPPVELDRTQGEGRAPPGKRRWVPGKRGRPPKMVRPTGKRGRPRKKMVWSPEMYTENNNVIPTRNTNDENPAFMVGDKIIARWGNEWFPGVIDGYVKSSRRWKVVWDEDGRFSDVLARDIRFHAISK